MDGPGASSSGGSNTSSNKLDFIKGVLSVPSFELRGLGSAFAQTPASAKSPAAAVKLSGRCSFVVREGFDPIDQSSTGRVVEGNGDVGFTLRVRKGLALSLTLGNLAYRTGLDDPLAAANQLSLDEGSMPSLKATLATEYKDEQYAAITWDFQQRKPEVSLAWSGETFTEKASLVLNADPVQRHLRVSAAIAFPGPEWRETVLNEDTGLIEEPEDDGGRHRIWLQHEVKNKRFMYRTRLGAALDLGRVVNWISDFVEYNVEPHIPLTLWRIPLLRGVYNIIIPAEDENQVRHHIKGWDLDVGHDFARALPTVGVTKHFKHDSISASYDLTSREYGVFYARGGVRIGAKIGKQAGLGWRNPSLHLQVEPLSLL